VLNVNFKTETGNKILVSLDDKCPMGLVRIDTTVSKYNENMNIAEESFSELCEKKDLWVSELFQYYFVNGDTLYNAITSMYESSDFIVTMQLFDIRKNVVDVLIMEALDPDDENDKYNKRNLSIRFHKYDICFMVKMRDIISALEIVTYKKEQ